MIDEWFAVVTIPLPNTKLKNECGTYCKGVSPNAPIQQLSITHIFEMV